MCRSVPQIPVRWTRIRTSLIPMVGSGTSSSHSPGFSYRLIRAFIMFPAVLYDDTFPMLTKKQIPTPATGDGSAVRAMGASSLTRSLHERDLVAIVINGVIGAGIFGLPGKLYALVGPYSLVAFIVCAFFVSLVVLCFAEVSSRFRDTGGPYLYARSAFGPAAGFQVGWLMWLARVSAFAANTNLLLTYLG